MTVFEANGTVSRALAELQVEGGPALDLPALAWQAGVPEEWLDQLDHGQLSSIGLQHLERLCRILGRSPNDLLGYEVDL
jgi:DNA-binding Xre family transcriptional regulator